MGCVLANRPHVDIGSRDIPYFGVLYIGVSSFAQKRGHIMPISVLKPSMVMVALALAACGPAATNTSGAVGAAQAATPQQGLMRDSAASMIDNALSSRCTGPQPYKRGVLGSFYVEASPNRRGGDLQQAAILTDWFKRQGANNATMQGYLLVDASNNGVTSHQVLKHATRYGDVYLEWEQSQLVGYIETKVNGCLSFVKSTIVDVSYAPQDPKQATVTFWLNASPLDGVTLDDPPDIPTDVGRTELHVPDRGTLYVAHFRRLDDLGWVFKGVDGAPE